MDTKGLRLLEYDKILGLLAEQAESEAGRQRCAELTPSDEMDTVNRLLMQTQAALRLINLRSTFSMRELKDMSETFKRIKVKGVLSISELMECAALLRTIRRLKTYRGDDVKLESVLDDWFESLSPNKSIEERLYNSFTNDLEVQDSASVELFRIRRAIQNAQARVRDSLNKMIHSPKYAKILQDPVITQRGGRFVVPVKAEYKNEVGGLVHDISSSGATLFIEPTAVVEANNEVRLLEGAEKNEIDRIMGELSELVFEIGENLNNDYKTCIFFDAIFARARLAIEMRASEPLMNEKGIINLRKARHPLLSRDTVVPIDVALGEQYDTLVITGPNTGGKTVTLKLVGLLCAMAQSGLYIPAADESRCAVFDQILTDVGDEQSIEQSLSTFSSHMTNIVSIIDKATSDSLCLFDELGAGTDPVEGAALSIAILEHVRRKGAKIVCTTHYPELKVYALKTKGVLNASCEFDVATLRPTYRLITGMPGRSNAFAISERLGLSKEIVESAAQHLTSDSIAFEQILSHIEESRQTSEKAKDEAVADRKAAAAHLSAVQEKQRQLEKELDKQFDSAKGQGLRIVESARAKVNGILEELDTLIKEKERADFKEKVGTFRQKVKGEFKELNDEIDPVREVKTEYELPRALAVGDTVEVAGIAKKATVASLPDSAGKVKVTAGVMSFNVNVKDVRLIKPPKAQKPYSPPLSSQAARTGSMELNVIGKTVAEMEPEVLQFVDGAVMSGLPSVTIVHGKGTGILRRAVWDLLKSHPHVKSCRLGTYGEGESGVTIVEMKE